MQPRVAAATRHGRGFAFELASLTVTVARSELPAAAVQATARLVQHAIGVCVAGRDLAVSRIARAAIGSAPGPCTVFGTTATHEAQDAAFANAVSGHASLLEDSGPGGKQEGSHPATYVFPAALAMAEQMNASGMDLLRAVCAAYEGVSRLGAAMPAAAFERGFRVVPVLGPFGAAAAAGVLTDLSSEQLAHSFGIAANLAGGFNQGFVDGTMEPYLHPAFAARNGLLAAGLAAAGCTASPMSLEGERGFFATFGGVRAAALDASVDMTQLAVGRVGTKRYATCLFNQGTLALLRKQFAQGSRVSDIAGVVLRRPAAGLNGVHAPGVASAPPYQTALARQMSARFTAAAALAGRPVEDATWFERAHEDEEVQGLAQRIEIAIDDTPGIAVEIAFRDGTRTTLRSATDAVLEFSATATAAQFADRVRPVLGGSTDEVLALLADLPRLDTLAPLMSLLRASSEPATIPSAQRRHA